MKEISWLLSSSIKKLNYLSFKSTSRYLDDLLNIGNAYFKGMLSQMYPPKLQFNNANVSDTGAPFLDLYLSISNGLFHP